MNRNGQCIIWTGYRKNGYGQLRIKDSRSPGSDHKTRCVHRMSLMVDIQNLDIPQILQASHMCNVKCCINTEFLIFDDNYTNNSRKLCFSIRIGEGKRPCFVNLDEKH